MFQKQSTAQSLHPNLVSEMAKPYECNGKNEHSQVFLDLHSQQYKEGEEGEMGEAATV